MYKHLCLCAVRDLTQPFLTAHIVSFGIVLKGTIQKSYRLASIICTSSAMIGHVSSALPAEKKLRMLSTTSLKIAAIQCLA